MAIARALVTSPGAVFADKPTGALGTAAEVHGLFRHAVDTPRATAVMVIHDPAAAAWADRLLIAALVTIFTASGTVALFLARRAREFALLRAVGATPRQIRRAVAAEALLLAPAAGLVGCLPGIGLAHWWYVS